MHSSAPFACLPALLVPVLLSAQASTPEQSPSAETTPPTQNTVSCSVIDPTNPMYFLDVWEKEPNGRLRPISLGRQLREDRCTRSPERVWDDGSFAGITHQVDRKSNILIEFDRDWLKGLKRFEGRILITADLSDDGGDVEVPGYSAYGEASQLAPVTIASGINLLSLINEFSIKSVELTEFVAKEVKRDSQVPDERPDEAVAREFFDIAISAAASAELRGEGLADQRERLRLFALVLRSQLEAFIEDEDLVGSAAEAIGGSDESVIAKAGNLIGIIGELVGTEGVDPLDADGLLLRMDVLDLGLAEFAGITRASSTEDEDLEAFQSSINDLRWSVFRREFPELDTARNKAILEAIRRRILEERRAIEAAIGQLLDPNNAASLRAISSLRRKDPEVLRAEVTSLRDDALPVLVEGPVTNARLAAVIQATRRLYAGLQSLRALGTQKPPTAAIGDDQAVRDDEDELKEILLDGLRTTSIALSQTPVRVGQSLRVRVTNGNRESGDYEQYTLVLPVRSFGWNEGLSDSFLFVRRMGVDSLPAVEAEGSVTTPKPTNYQPAAGVTLAWTYQPRPSHQHRNSGLGFLNGSFLGWLRPGIGVNVSFPSFGSRTRAFVSDTSTVRVADTIVVVENRTLTVEEDANPVDIAVGAVVTLFSNQVQFSYGWNLTSGSGENRQYFAVGFSFVNIARRIGGGSDSDPGSEPGG